jgi:hypothetical protein
MRLLAILALLTPLGGVAHAQKHRLLTDIHHQRRVDAYLRRHAGDAAVSFHSDGRTTTAASLRRD